ncbi:MAG TPA: magnesium transporter [Erysipelotrichaceae bacterium]|nr:magnesium transporter [Erysipelotrichaceae bacterium]
MEVEKEVLYERIISAVKNRKASEIKEIFETIPNIDIAETLDEVDDAAVFLYIFRNVSSEYTGSFFTELNSNQQEMIINAFTDKQLLDLLRNSFADDIVDTLEEMPANVVNKVLKACPASLRKDVNSLLNYKENTAGSVMTTEYLDLKEDLTVEEALKLIRQRGKDAETIYTVFVRDNERTLKGTINLDDLIFSNDNELLKDIMDLDFVTCKANDDQEEVANMFKRYGLTALAVVNNENKIIGIITIDDVVDIIVEEASEDIARLHQISDMDEPYLKTPVLKIVLKCAPWILALIVLQVFSTWILSGFQPVIARLALLSVFTPVIMDAGGNAGGQTTTMIVRSISLQEFGKGDFKRVVWKELRVAVVIGLMVFVFSFLWLLFEMSVGIVDVSDALVTIRNSNPNISSVMVKVIVAFLVSTTLFITMVVSRLIACALPFVAKKIKIDPAVMCGPVTTTIVDIITLLAYFLLWIGVFSKLLGL